MEVNATALRLLLERLVDELDELERMVWAEPGPERDRGKTFSRDDLRQRIGDSMMLACSALDGLTEA